MSSFLETLKTYWGYDSFRPLQEDIIHSISEGKDTLGLMPTGGGKSLTFQVPVMQMEGICIVITPLIALMKDQVDNLKQKGIKAAAVYSGMNRNEVITTFENCIFGNYKFLYLSPERLSTELFLTKLRYMNVCLIVVDESHCISQWGYDFRPSYLRIAEIRKFLPGIPLLALTATATAEVADDIQEKLLFREKNIFRAGFERKNIAYVIRKTEDKLFEAINIINKIPGSGIVYVRSRKKTKELAMELITQGVSSDYFHAGLTREEKDTRQNNWKSGECRIMVCTNAFGMGIDKPDVRIVVHFEMPGSLEEYFQEAGRAGRDGGKAYAVALYSERDTARLKKRINDEFPDRDYIKDVYEKLAYYFQIAVNSGFQTTCNFELEPFCSVFKYSFTQVHYAIKLLQLSGYIDYVEETDKQSRLMFITRRDDLYKYTGFDNKTDDLIQIILRSYTGLFAEYVYINENILSSRSGLTRHEIYEILKMLSSQQIIHFIPAQKIPTITYTQNREEIKYLSIPSSIYEDRKSRLLSRIQSVIEYSSMETVCRSRTLIKYFGEKDLQDCGQCDICLKKKKNNIDSDVFNQISTAIFVQIDQTECRLKELLSTPDFPEEQIIQVVRFLSDTGKIKLLGDIVRKAGSDV